MPPFITALLSSGLRLVANAALVKGKAFVEEKTGVRLDQEELSEEDQLRLRQFQMEHEEELLRLQLEDNKLGLEEARLQLEQTRAYLADTADARAQQTALQTSAAAPWFTKAVQPALAVFGVVVTFSLFAVFVSWAGGTHLVTGPDGKQTLEPTMNPTQKDLVVYILGVLSAVVTQIFSYYFGSSAGSARKTEQLQQALNQQPPA
ncbi:MAG: hypothetical protein IT369_03685 [Candidatus Latescibacteria bacterium]|nr:hypothetical protein [Candidatus Latescibacterota bacterium]